MPETETGPRAGTERIARDALIAQHRRTARASSLAGSVWLPVALLWRVRQARRTRDPWAWAAITLTVATPVLGNIVNYRRAEQRADDDLERQANLNDIRRRVQAREPVPGYSTLPAGRTPTGCSLQVGRLLGGLVQAGWDYCHRPDRHRHVNGRAWVWRPGPAWWTAWSFQQLPVNAASTAPRGAQIAYQRRQLLTLRVTGTLGTAIEVWQTQQHRGIADRDLLRVAAGAIKLTMEIVRGIADYRLMPDTVDHQRDRRRRHNRAVTALHAARAVGQPGPRNPWATDMLATAAATAAVAGFATNAVTAARAQRRLAETQQPAPGSPTTRG